MDLLADRHWRATSTSDRVGIRAALPRVNNNEEASSVSASARTIRILSVVAISGLMALAASSITKAETAEPPAREDGIVKVKSAYPVHETISRLKQDSAAKGIMFFMALTNRGSPLRYALSCSDRRPQHDPMFQGE
jgi:hypothetical protein